MRPNYLKKIYSQDGNEHTNVFLRSQSNLMPTVLELGASLGELKQRVSIANVVFIDCDLTPSMSLSLHNQCK